MKKFLLLLFVSLFVFCEGKYCPNQLFVLFDAGETNALLPVIEKLEEQNQNYNILAFGTSQKLIAKYNHRVIEHDQIGISEKVDAFWDRNRPLSVASLQAIQKNVEPKKVLVGVASRIQAQCLEIFGQYASLFAYRDNMNCGGQISDVVQRYIPASTNAAVLFPSCRTADFYQNENYQRFIVGKPSLELLEKQVAAPETRLKALQKVGLDNFKGRIVCWIGGYDEPGKNLYAKALDLFKKSLEKSPEKLRVIVQLHPKAKEQNQQIEKNTLGSDPRVVWFSDSQQLSMAETLAVSDLVATYQSSVGFDAVVCGKKTVYVAPEQDQMFKPPIEVQTGFAACIRCPQTLDFSVPKFEISFKEMMGIPSNSISNILEIIK